MLLEAYFPVFVGIGQFGPHILPFQKQANRLWAYEMLCIPQKLVERRASAGGHDIEGLLGGRFHAGVADFEVQPQPSANFRKKRALLGDRLEQRDLNPIP